MGGFRVWDEGVVCGHEGGERCEETGEEHDCRSDLFGWGCDVLGGVVVWGKPVPCFFFIEDEGGRLSGGGKSRVLCEIRRGIGMALIFFFRLRNGAGEQTSGNSPARATTSF
jgi:hypothetical protein